MDPAPLANGLASNPLAWMLAIALVVIGYLYRAREADHAARLEEQRADAKAQRELLMQIVPLSTKLTEGLEILERVTDSLTAEDDDR